MSRSNTTTADGPAPPAWWKRPPTRLAFSGLVLAALFLLLPFRELVEAIRSIPVAVWPVALVTYLSLHLIGVAKWRLMVNAAGAALSFRDAARAYYSGLFGNTFLPSIVGGDVLRIAVASTAVRSKTALLFGSLIDRLQDVAGLTAVAGIGALISPRALSPESRLVFVGLGALLLLGGLAAVAAAVVLRTRLVPYRIRRVMVRVRRAVRATASRPGAMAMGMALGMMLQTLLVVLNWWLGRQVGIDIPLYVWLFVWPLAKVAGLVPLTQGGIGVREAAQVALFAPFGVAPVAALASGLVFEAVILVGGLAGGVIAHTLRRRATEALL
ncbi:MAG: lysylphosphatidylglycerol synthase transmembrane domain-containing protein [Vicinamibacterales bacterium]